MPDLLLELFSEEIPARMQGRAAEDLRMLVTDALVEHGLVYEGADSFATPRRLALVVAGLPARARDTREERKGPRVGAPEAAIQGFLRAAGLTSIHQATIQSDPKKGDSYLAVIEKPGRATIDVLAELLPALIRTFPWPKAMRWGAASGPAGTRYLDGDGRGADALRWVRPLKAILCTLDDGNGEPLVVPFAIDGLKTGEFTFGHRFLHGAAPIRARRFEEYEAGLMKAKVMLRPDLRRREILRQAKELCDVQGLELVPDEGLLDEVTGLVEWPVCLMGAFDAAFLAVPEPAIRATIRANQKCFVVRDPATGRLANRFIATANTEAADGGATIIAGNARVIRARLSDARFFFETDLKVPLDARLEKLASVRFHEKLGTQGERVQRIAELAREIAPMVGADPARAERAARLAKADLATEMVGEFPELQGLMGRIYAERAGEHPDIALAIEEHYKPVGPSDRVPTNPVSIAVALADKLDTLVGFWAIDEKPTGSKDPYALRRAALGVIRLVVENRLSVSLGQVFETVRSGFSPALTVSRVSNGDGQAKPEHDALGSDLLSFFHDRLKVMLRDQGQRPDLVDAVLAAGAGQAAGNDDLLAIVRRVAALAAMLATEDGANLLGGYRRAANILRAEEKKDGAGTFDRPVETALLVEPQERAFAAALDTAGAEAARQLAATPPDYAAAMRAVAGLRPAVDDFFEAILVNADAQALRQNRLALLARLRAVTRTVADLTKIAG